MKIDKITFKNSQAWIVVESDNDEYLGTWHVANSEFVKALQKELPNKIRVWNE